MIYALIYADDKVTAIITKRKMLTIKFIFLSWLVFVVSEAILRCSRIHKVGLYNLDYYLMQTCTNSSSNVIAKTFASDVEDCKEFSAKRFGFGFNYANLKNIENVQSNCIVYDCPEYNVTSLKQYESLYQYYSVYASIFPSENMTCIPKEGIFMYSGEKLNYTEASSKCVAYGGKLVNILSEDSTNRIANILTKSEKNHGKLVQVYVGLNDMDQEGVFVSVNDEPLNCVSFRAWAPGEPRNKYSNEDCVTMDTARYWRVQPCNKTLPFICEIVPHGPLDLTLAYCANIEESSIKKECYDYYSSTEIEIENEICNRTEENNLG